MYPRYWSMIHPVCNGIKNISRCAFQSLLGHTVNLKRGGLGSQKFEPVQPDVGSRWNISSVFAETCMHIKISTFPPIFERLVVGFFEWKASGSYPEDWLKGDQKSRGHWKGHLTFCRGGSGTRKIARISNEYRATANAWIHVATGACHCDYLQIDCEVRFRRLVITWMKFSKQQYLWVSWI